MSSNESIQKCVRCPRCRSPFTKVVSAPTHRAFTTNTVESGKVYPQYRRCLSCEHKFRIFVEAIEQAALPKKKTSMKK